MLHYGQNTGCKMRISDGAGQLGDLCRGFGVTAIAQEGMGFGAGNVGDRRTIGVNTHRPQLFGHHPCPQPQNPRGCFACGHRGIQPGGSLTPGGGDPRGLSAKGRFRFNHRLLQPSDPGRAAFVLFSPQGEPLAQFAYAGELQLPTGIAATSSAAGHVIAVVDTRACSVSAWRLAEQAAGG